MTGPSLPHLAFIDALGELTESAPQWPRTLAGFLTLRFVDKWADAMEDECGPLLREVNAVQRAVAQIDDQRTRTYLNDLVSSACASWGTRSPAVTSALLAYAQHLRDLEAWAMAADAFETFVTHARTDEERRFIPLAYVRLGACLRVAGDPDAALSAYRAGEIHAERAGDTQTALLAQLGAAHVMKDRGNYPVAEAMLERVIADASSRMREDSTADLTDVLARAKHDRGVVATDRGDTERAVTLYFEALNAYKDERGRERVLADIAYNLTALGLHDAARDAFQVLHTSAREPYGRAIAAINLMHLAQLEGRELEFEQCRRELATCSLPPRGAAHYHLYAGEGLHRFGRQEAARVAFEKAIELAERHKLNTILIQAEASLAAMERHEDPPPVPATPAEDPPPAVAHVVRAVRELWEQAGATL
jgi:tetratricopeptide (TPR) repeat protein